MIIVYCRQSGNEVKAAGQYCQAAGASHAAGTPEVPIEHTDFGQVEVDDDPMLPTETEDQYFARLKATYGHLFT